MQLLLEHLKRNRDVLLKYSDLIGIAEHKTNLGTAREALITNFLQQNLPELISYYSGEIFDSRNHRSGQIDIILQPKSSPKLNLFNTMNIFPVETVLAAIEVKTNLTTGAKGSFNDALVNCKKLKELDKFIEKRNSDFIVDYIEPKKIPYIIFALNGPTEDTLISSFDELWSSFGSEQNFVLAPDMIIVLSQGTNQNSYSVRKSSNWWAATTNTTNLYTKSYVGESVLISIFELLLTLVEDLMININHYYMPIDLYIKGIPKGLF